MSKITVQIYKESGHLSQSAAELFTQIVLESVQRRDKFYCALSGGGTPMALYQLLSLPPFSKSLPWGKMYFFWGDERCVPPDGNGSNYYQANRVWLAKVPVPKGNIFRIKGELAPQLAAEDYAHQLKTFAERGFNWPRFDYILLGLGADGHTASLFPGSLMTTGLATVAVTANYQDRPSNRVSLTPDVINSAYNIVFLVTGAEKAGSLAATLTGSRKPDLLPAQRIQLSVGKLWWLVDEAAASLLPKKINGIEIRYL